MIFLWTESCGVGGVFAVFVGRICEGILTYSTHMFGNRKADLSLVALDFFVGV